MAGKKLTIKLTDDQQNQIQSATGRRIAELNIDVGSTGQLSEKDLENVAGGELQKPKTLEERANEWSPLLCPARPARS